MVVGCPTAHRTRGYDHKVAMLSVSVQGCVAALPKGPGSAPRCVHPQNCPQATGIPGTGKEKMEEELLMLYDPRVFCYQ